MNENNENNFDEDYKTKKMLDITKINESEYLDNNSLAKIEKGNENTQNQKEKLSNYFDENSKLNLEGKILVNNYEVTKNIGLKNIGHTCYMNSFLQIILHTPTFLTNLKKYYKNNIDRDTITNNLIKLSENPNETHYLYEIKKIISKTYPQYGSFVQNDTQKFAIDFLDSIIAEIKNENSYVSDSLEEPQIIIQSEKDNKAVKIEKFNKFKLDFESLGEQTFIEDLFLLSESKINYEGKLIKYLI